MRRALSAALAVLALTALAACSSGGDDDDAAPATTVTTVAVQTTPSYTGSADSEFCRLSRSNLDRVREIGANVSNPEALTDLLNEAAPAVRQAASVAPPDIKSDVSLLADGFEKLRQSFDAGQPDYGVLSQPSFQQAYTNLGIYARDVCGITP